MDADTAIIKKALTAAKDSPVNVFADDTDILSLLINYMTVLLICATLTEQMYTRNKKENVTMSLIY